MNLAIEYLLRRGSKGMLRLPCSLMVRAADFPYAKMVVAIHPGEGDRLLVRHWMIDDPGSRRSLPPVVEHAVPRADLFASPHVVLEGHTLLDFEERPVHAGKVQRADPPDSIGDEVEHEQTLAEFLHPCKHARSRADFVWEAFQRNHLPTDLSMTLGRYPIRTYAEQQAFTRCLDKDAWDRWSLWHQVLVDYPGPAPEFVFAREYAGRRHGPAFEYVAAPKGWGGGPPGSDFFCPFVPRD